jgi:hypothetical protein
MWGVVEENEREAHVISDSEARATFSAHFEHDR